MKRILSYVLTMIMALTLVNVNVLATEAVNDPVSMPSAKEGVITLEAGKVYEGLTITDALTIEGNGASIDGKITIETSDPVVIKNVKLLHTGDRKTQLEVSKKTNNAETETDLNYLYDISIENVQFGEADLPEEAGFLYRNIHFPDGGISTHVGSKLSVKNSVFYGATYSINLLHAEEIEIINNKFYGKGTAIQYSLNSYTKSVNITNNTFDKPSGYQLLVTLTAGSFDSEVADIGNVTDNAFVGEARTFSLSINEKSISTLNVPFNKGITPHDIFFSSYSANEKFKPATTGPLGDLEGVLLYGPLYVRFQVDGMQQQEVYYNDKAVEPTAPTKEGHTFAGWYKDVELKTAWKFDEDVVLNDVELYAKWNINSYKVTFKDHDDKVIGEVQTIEYGKGALKPKDPVREGYTFKGWDKAFDKVTGDLVVKAEYLANPKAEVEADKKEIEVEVKGLDDAVTFTEAERQNEVGVKLEVSVLEEKDVPKADQKLIDDFIKETLKVEDAKVLVLDISLFKVVGKETSAVHDANKPITISFKLPEAYVGLEFEILRVHDGKVEKLKYDYDEKTQMVSFETDKFSTYAVAAKAADEEKKPEDKLPGMGDNSHAGWLFLLAGGLLLIASKRKGFARK